MKSISQAIRDYLKIHPYETGDPDCENILDLLYRAYAETHESDPPEIQSGFCGTGGVPENTTPGR